MKYIISGATSFIGLSLIESLLSNGDEVFAICRENSKKFHLLPNTKRLHILFADASNYSSLYEKYIKADVFIHLAWLGTDRVGRVDDNIQQQNVVFSLQAIDLAFSCGCKLFVDSGSQAEYGIVNGKITEDTVCYPEIAYGKAKLEFYERAQLKCLHLGLKYVHLRILSIYGERDHDRTLIQTCISAFLQNKEMDLSESTQKWNYLYVKDASLLIIKIVEYTLLNKEYFQQINLASNDTRFLKEFIEEIHLLTKSRSCMNFGAFRPEKIISLDPDISVLLSCIGRFEFTTFKQGINNIIKYYNGEKS